MVLSFGDCKKLILNTTISIPALSILFFKKSLKFISNQNKMTRPKIQLQPESIDRVLDILALVLLLAIIGLPIYHYSSLPNTIPIHYNFTGAADNTGHKAWIWLLPIIGTILLLVLRLVIRSPHRFNYPVAVTEANAEQLYRSASRMMRISNILIMAIFLYLVYATIIIAYEQQEGLNKGLMLFLVLALVGCTIYYSISMKKAK